MQALLIATAVLVVGLVLAYGIKRFSLGDRNLAPGEPVSMTLQLGRGDYYQAPVIAEYIRVLSQHDPDMSVVVIDPAGKYVASAKGSVVLAQLTDTRNPDQTYQLMDALRGSNPSAILKIGGFSDKSIADTASNVEALRKMQSENTARLVAVTPARAPEGVVLRDMIVTRLLVELAPADK
ncbi:MAG: hypothetical protein E5W56_01665 [Mesorhizobium sp.]|nr:MAG: hypothetical protein E5W56_01665 [Mesorhizobium sp.]